MGLFPVGKSSNITRPPPQATAAGLNRIVFYDDMQSLSTFDLADTKDVTKKWFLDPAWPSVGNDGTAGGISAQESWAAFPPADAGNFFFQAQSGARTGSCVIQTSGAGADPVHGVNSLISFSSAAYSASGPGYVGTMFTPPFYAESRLTWTTLDTGFGPPAFWALPKSFLDGTTDTYLEIDVMESHSTASGQVHSAIVKWSPYPTTNPSVLLSVNSTFARGKFQTFGWLWTTIAQGGGTGSHKFYCDNLLTSTYSYTASDTVEAAAESMQFALYFSNQFFNNFCVDKVMVCQA